MLLNIPTVQLFCSIPMFFFQEIHLHAFYSEIFRGENVYAETGIEKGKKTIKDAYINSGEMVGVCMDINSAVTMPLM